MIMAWNYLHWLKFISQQVASRWLTAFCQKKVTRRETFTTNYNKERVLIFIEKTFGGEYKTNFTK